MGMEFSVGPLFGSINGISSTLQTAGAAAIQSLLGGRMGSYFIVWLISFGASNGVGQKRKPLWRGIPLSFLPSPPPHRNPPLQSRSDPSS